jgi:hypothetical protein
MLNLEYSFIWCWNLDVSGSNSETHRMFWNMVLEEDWEDQFDRPCEKLRSILRVKKQRNILHEIRKRKANWICHILCRNCLLRQVIEGQIKGGIEMTGIRGRRRSKLLDDLEERRGYSHLKEEAVDRTMWRAHFGRKSGPVVRKTTKKMTHRLCAYSHTHIYLCCRKHVRWPELILNFVCFLYGEPKFRLATDVHYFTLVDNFPLTFNRLTFFADFM